MDVLGQKEGKAWEGVVEYLSWKLESGQMTQTDGIL